MGHAARPDAFFFLPGTPSASVEYSFCVFVRLQTLFVHPFFLLIEESNTVFSAFRRAPLLAEFSRKLHVLFFTDGFLQPFLSQ